MEIKGKGVLYIPQISKAGASPIDCLMSYQDTRCGEGGSYHTAEMQSAYSKTPSDWA